MDKLDRKKRRIKAKLIFNPGAGSSDQSPVQLLEVIREMQSWNLIPEPFIVEPGSDLTLAVSQALEQGIRLFVVCGGDGTISTVAGLLAGKKATLGIIPTGTQNNTALSLGIPSKIPEAIAILRNGRLIKMDIGIATCGKKTTPFLEVCSVGLVSSLFPSADDVQHGNLARVGDLLAVFASTPPAEIHLTLDNQETIKDKGYVVLVSNMPYLGFHYQVGSKTAHKDGLLDVLYFADLSKMDLLSYIFQGVGEGKPEDPRIQHYLVQKVDISSKPLMPVMTDGFALGKGRVRIEVRKGVLGVMVGKHIKKEKPTRNGFMDQQRDG